MEWLTEGMVNRIRGGLEIGPVGESCETLQQVIHPPSLILYIM